MQQYVLSVIYLIIYSVEMELVSVNAQLSTSVIWGNVQIVEMDV